MLQIKIVKKLQEHVIITLSKLGYVTAIIGVSFQTCLTLSRIRKHTSMTKSEEGKVMDGFRDAHFALGTFGLTFFPFLSFLRLSLSRCDMM